MESHDPFAERESKKYSKPIVSREYLLRLLEERGKPATYEQLLDILEITDPEQQEALRRRLRAMARDGQLMPNRRGAYGLVASMNLVAGRVSAHKDGFGFVIPDKGGDDIFLNSKQMRQVFHGDRVLVTASGRDFKGRQEGRIVEVIERNTEELVGQFFEESGVSFVQPSGKQFTQNIIIPREKTLNAKSQQMVQVRIIEQPGSHRQAIGAVTEILGEHMAPGMEIDLAIRSYQLPYRWPEAVQQEIQNFGQDVPHEAIEGRKDIRDLPLVTIDGEDAKDFDDAVYCAKKDGGGWRLIVAIADVSSYVKPGTALDEEAKKRGNSVYFPGRVIPMLPEILSNGLC
ncbi:MAG: RNB domain-containing ribonuclease, partial [Gammaproteobacteria bacterium]|nr:RNB domain-containing ribonuclease [Gammaproteobacteria bacterium]